MMFYPKLPLVMMLIKVKIDFCINSRILIHTPSVAKRRKQNAETLFPFPLKRKKQRHKSTI